MDLVGCVKDIQQSHSNMEDVRGQEIRVRATHKALGGEDG